jgi:excisionase family DNA binding protein
MGKTPETIPPLSEFPSRLFKTSTAEQILDCGRTTIDELIGEGRLRAIKFGRRMKRIEGQSILDLLASTPRVELKISRPERRKPGRPRKYPAQPDGGVR